VRYSYHTTTIAMDGHKGDMNQIIASEGATVASTVLYLLPVVAIILGVLVLSESITAIILAGIALVLTGVALTRHRTASSGREP
jgi:drug/metabolite transporter (DMT)-like permease